MKFKGLLFVCLIICFFTITSVCAGDFDQNQVNQNETQDIAVDDNNILSETGEIEDLAQNDEVSALG